MTGTDQRRGAPDDGHRMTKAERREEARLKREEIQRAMASRKRNRRIGLVLVVVAVVIADPKTKQHIDSLGIKLINYRDLAQMKK